MLNSNIPKMLKFADLLKALNQLKLELIDTLSTASNCEISYCHQTGLRRASLLIGLTLGGLISCPETVQAQKLQVGVVGSPPFVIQEGENFTGIGLNIWQDLAEAEGLDYELILQKNVPASIDAVASGELDIAIGPISITPERLERSKIEFTQPFYVAQIRVLLPAQRPTLWSRVQPFFRLAALSSIGVMIILLLLVGNLIWLAERRENPEQFPDSYLRGVGNGMWFALTTLTTVGYGDRAPVTPLGRLIAGVWMVVTLLTVSSLTAGLASAFTLSLSALSAPEKFTHPKDLQDERIAVVSGTTGVKWGEYYQARLQETETLKDAIDLVVSGQVEGVIFDAPALKYYLRQHPKLDLRLSSFVLSTHSYGFVLPRNTPLEQSLNISLLKLQESGRIQEITDQWLQ